MDKTYDANSIQKLTFREGVRLRVGMYLGSADHTGVMAGLLELINNATDEALVCKNATQIDIEIGKDWASCLDRGRGMPHGPNDFSEEVMINLLTESHSGGKFNDNAYGGKTRGLNGIGSAATCCSSDSFKITSYRDGYAWYMEFDKGIPLYSKCQQLPLNGHEEGTYIWYKPSQDVFNAEPIYFDYNEICNIIKTYSFFNKGITFNIKNCDTNEETSFCSENGLSDFADTVINAPVHNNRLYFSGSENNIDVEVIMQWTKGKEKFYLFSNGGENPDGGTPITGIKTAITNFFKKQKHVIDGDMARTGLTYICSVNLSNPMYDGQTKTKITNPELKGLLQKICGEMLDEFATSKPNEFASVMSYLKNYQKAEAAANATREAMMELNKDVASLSKKKMKAPIKLIDCENHGEDSILYICEGKSAKTPIQNAKSILNEAVYDIRGRLILVQALLYGDIQLNSELRGKSKHTKLVHDNPVAPTVLQCARTTDKELLLQKKMIQSMPVCRYKLT